MTFRLEVLPLAVIYGALLFNSLSDLYTSDKVVWYSSPVASFLLNSLILVEILLKALPKSLDNDDDSPQIYLSKLNWAVAFNTFELL